MWGVVHLFMLHLLSKPDVMEIVHDVGIAKDRLIEDNECDGTTGFVQDKHNRSTQDGSVDGSEEHRHADEGDLRVMHCTLNHFEKLASVKAKRS